MKTTIKSYHFRNPKNGDICSLELNFNAFALLDEKIEFEIKGNYYSADENISKEVLFLVQYDDEQNCIKIKYNATTIARINLNDNISITNNFDDLDAQDAFDEIYALMDDSSAIESVINDLPAVDPIFGCIIKSGLSTTIGQIIKCNKQVPKDSNFRKKLRPILDCLGKNKYTMLSKFTLRTLKCMLFFGWDIF
jgi:hypothetical protein